MVFPAGDGAKVLLQDGEYGISAGQACVFYSDVGPKARVLGGGWIQRALSRAEQARHTPGETGLNASDDKPPAFGH